MPAALPDPDIPLKRAAPSGGWIGPEPTAYAVRAQDAEDALTLALYCYYVLQGCIPPKYAGRVAHSLAELSELPAARTAHVHHPRRPSSRGRAGTTGGCPPRSRRSCKGVIKLMIQHPRCPEAISWDAVARYRCARPVHGYGTAWRVARPSQDRRIAPAPLTALSRLPRRRHPFLTGPRSRPRKRRPRRATAHSDRKH